MVSKVKPHRSQQLNFNKSICDQNAVLVPAIYFGLKSKPQATAVSDPRPSMESFSQKARTAGSFKQSILSNQLFPKAFVPSAQDFPVWTSIARLSLLCALVHSPGPAADLRPDPNGIDLLAAVLPEPKRL